MSKIKTFLIVSSIFISFFNLNSSLADEQKSNEYIGLSLEELMEEEVFSHSKREEKAFTVESALFVVTNEDIKRAGVESIPEALRLVPGVQVSRINSSIWSISIRGFSNQFANKLLVLIDGKSVYTPLFSGVYWNDQDLILDDVERIEVIRGPGGTIWGANAVNGVINIITKNSNQTQGNQLSAGVGSYYRNIESYRYGGKLSDNATYRAYVKHQELADLKDSGQGSPFDSSSLSQAGFRSDYQQGGKSLMLKGDSFFGEENALLTTPRSSEPLYSEVQEDTDKFGGSLLAKWTNKVSLDTGYSLQAYYDLYDRDDILAKQHRDLLDLEFNHDFKYSNNNLIYGLNYRFYTQELKPNADFISYGDDSIQDHLFSFFLQDQIKFFENKVTLTFGSKFEHNEYSGFEAEPNVRLGYHPNKDNTFWAAISKGVRTPAIAERNLKLNLSSFKTEQDIIAVTRLVQDSDVSERLIAYELGYRHNFDNIVLWDTAVFLNKYSDLSGPNQGVQNLINDDQGNYLEIPINYGPSNKAYSYGGEISLATEPISDLTLNMHYMR